MKLRKLSFAEQCQGWSIEDFAFENLTLLVGASGTGKSQTLHAIATIAEIASGKNMDGIKWDVTFTVSGDNGDLVYRWCGEFQKINIPTHVRLWEDEIRSKIVSESLFIDDKIVVERKGAEILYHDKATINLSPYISLLAMLRHEPPISRAYRAFRKVFLIDRTTGDDLKDIKKHTDLFSRAIMDKERYDTIDKIRRSGYSAIVKLDMARQIKAEAYTEITERFIEIFPQVTTVKIAPISGDKGYMSAIPFVQIKEKGSTIWIPQFNMSAGMCRTLTQIAQMYLCPEGTLFLIDEFENSLGVNCIEDLTGDLLTTERDLQFILSSHSAYIINNIDMHAWRLVSRKGSHIQMRPVDELLDEDSAHEYYMQLLQLEEYRTGR